jgi:nitrogen fixation-related uncharacterized protein
VSESPTRKCGTAFGPMHVFFITAVLCAGCMFTFKLFSFMKTIKKDELAGFAFDPILIYGFVAMGFLFLLCWAYLSGQFKDIERPKYEMLERFAEQERSEGLRFDWAEGGEDVE